MKKMILIAVIASMAFPALSCSGASAQTSITGGEKAVVDVSASFAAIVSNYNLPGLMGQRLDGSSLTASGVAGVRVRGQNTNMLQAADVMHYGSMFKVQTATMGGILVDTNVITWDALLLDYVTPSQKTAFIATDVRWTNVTLRQLLSMSSGIQEGLVPFDVATLYSYNTNPVAGRQYLVDALSHSLLATDPGSAYYYSNFGYTMAGLMLEVAWNQFSGLSNTYEELMQQKLFGPLGITTATQGAPGMSTTVLSNLPAADPSPVAIGHNAHTNDPAVGYPLGAPVGLGYVDADNPLIITPAGAWAMGMDDYIKLLKVHMQTNQTALLDSLGLTFQTLLAIRTPVIVLPTTNAFSFALGWVVDNATTSHLVYTGSNVRWVSMVDVKLDQQVAVVAACNQGGTDPALHDAFATLEAIPEPALGTLAVILCVRLRRRAQRGPARTRGAVRQSMLP